MVETSLLLTETAVLPEPKREPTGGAALRRHTRHETKLHASLYIRSFFQPVIIYNLSASGFGLAGTPSLLAGEKVNIKLIDGRSLAARVSWWAQGKCGIELSVPLRADDPLLLTRSAGWALQRS